LSHIARRYGTSVSALQLANVGVQPQRIKVGQRIRIPGGSQAAAATAPAAPTRTRWTRHQVRRGDSLWSISRRYGVSVGQLQAWNGLGRRSKIMVGQSLRIRA
jgi:membrane-bound lytic murein transglycosylase D